MLPAAHAANSQYLVQRQDFTKELIFTGELKGVDSVIIAVPWSSMTYSFVISHLAPEGTLVQPGDLLVDFDAGDLATQRPEQEKKREEAKINIAQKEAEIETQRQDLLLAKATAEKNLKTAELDQNIDPELIARADAEKYEFDYAKAKTELEKAESRLATLEESSSAELQILRLAYERADLQLMQLLGELRKMRIVAPMSGLVIHGPSPGRVGRIQVGDIIWAGWPVILLPNMKELRVETYVYDADFHLLEEGMPANMVFDAIPGETFRGRVSRLPRVAKPRQPRSQLKAFQVDVLLGDPDHEMMRPGMTAQVKIPVIRRNVLTVPRGSLHMNANGSVAVRKANASQLTPLSVLDASWEHVVVEGDLEPGDVLTLPSSSTLLSEEDQEWIEVQRQDLLFTVAATGVLEAEKSVSLGPPLLKDYWQYKIIRMAPEGSEVKAGDFLLAFDPTEVGKRLREEKASCQKTQEKYEKTKTSKALEIKNLELELEEARVQQQKSQNRLIQAKELDSDIEVQKARFEAELDQRKVEFLEKKLNSVRQNVILQMRLLKDTEALHQHRVRANQKALDSLTIAAPVSGVIIYEKNFRNEKKRVGSQVNRMEKVITLPDLKTLVVKARVAELDAGKVRIGQPVVVKLAAIPNRSFNGRIAEIGTIFRPASPDRPVKVLDIKIELDEVNLQQMRPGMMAKVRLIVDRFEDALSVPLPTVQVENERHFVWVEGENGPEKREIHISDNNGIVAVVDSGLSEGVRVASKPFGSDL